MKQETLAKTMGISRQVVSKIEQSATLEEDVLNNVADALGISTDAISNFSEEAVVNYFNTFNDNSFSHSNAAFHASSCTFNPLDKLMEVVEENRKLYERLLQEKEQMIEMYKKKQ